MCITDTTTVPMHCIMLNLCYMKMLLGADSVSWRKQCGFTAAGGSLPVQWMKLDHPPAVLRFEGLGFRP